MTEVYKAIAAVQGELAKIGIGKDRRNEQQSYNFRGIDDVYAALSPLLSKHQLCMIPRILSCSRAERVTTKTWNGQAKESVLFYVTVHAEFDFVSAVDGSKHTAATFGEAMDSGDKATNKAMSAAYKYVAFMTFGIPTEGDNDADATTHDVVPQRRDGPDMAMDRSTEPTITDEQRDIIAGLSDAAKMTPQQICEAYGIGSLVELPASKYPELRSRLDERIQKLNRKKAA